MGELPKKLHTIYLSEGYNAVAIITKEQEAGEVPYLDKFSISQKTQVRQDCNLLFNFVSFFEFLKTNECLVEGH